MTSNSRKYDGKKPRILYLDMAYTLKMVKERELEQEFSSRDCGGYFEHVWGVHPVADIPENRKKTYEGFRFTQVEFSDNQTIIEGVSAYYTLLKFSFPLNFIVSQTRFLIFLVRLVKCERISIIFSTDPYFSGLLGLLIKMFTKAKLVIWVVGNNDEIYEASGAIANPRLFRWRWVEKIIERRVFRRADLVAGSNQNNLEFALNNGARLNKSTIFPNGRLIHRQHLLEPGLRTKDEVFNTSSAVFHFIYIGRLIDIKFADDVLRAFTRISQTVQNCALIMAGDGPMKPELEKLAIEMGINEKVNFVGNINQIRLANILAGCFAVLSPITGRSLIEGALAGLPIVAYDRDWQAEFLSRNNSGIIVPFREWQKMADSAIYLVQNPVEAERMAAASRKTGLDTCDEKKLFEHEQKEFDKLLKRSNNKNH